MHEFSPNDQNFYVSRYFGDKLLEKELELYIGWGFTAKDMCIGKGLKAGVTCDKIKRALAQMR